MKEVKTSMGLMLILMILGMAHTQSETENATEEELRDMSKFKDYSLKRAFKIIDMEPHHQYYYFYFFNMLAKRNQVAGTDMTLENQFFFEMYYYNRKYPDTEVGPTLDFTQKDLSSPQSLEIKDTMIAAIRVKPDFYKAELKIPKNDCLTLFIFLDSQEDTKYELDKHLHDVHFDFRENRFNNFDEAVQNYFGHNQESFDVVYNDLDYDGDLFIKVVCPFYSNFGNDEIKIELKMIPKDYQFDGEWTSMSYPRPGLANWQ